MAGANPPADDGESDILLASADATVLLPEPLFTRICWHVLPILWLGYVANIVDRTNLGYAQLQMSHDLSLSPRAFGLASGLFFVGYCIMQVPFNHLMLQIGSRRILACSMVAWGCISSATSLAPGERSLYALRFALGIAESGYYPGTLLYLTKWFPEANQGRALAYFSTAASVGGIIASAGSGVTMTLLEGVGGIRGWRWLLAIQGLPTVVLGAMLPAVLCERPRDATWLSGEEKAALLAALEADGKRGHQPLPPPLLQTLQSALALPRTRGFIVQYMGVSCLMNGARFFLPSQLKEAFPTWSPARIGCSFALVALAKVLAIPHAARRTEGDDARRARTVRACFLGSAAVLLAAGCGMLLERSSRATALACVLLLVVVCADIATQMAIPLFWAMHHAAQPPSDVACSIALVNAIGNLGGFIGPWLLGAMHDSTALSAAACADTLDRRGRCFAQWAAGTATIGLVLMGTTSYRLWVDRRASSAEGRGARATSTSRHMLLGS